MNTYILPFWKKIGTSSSIIAKRVSEKLKLPTSHTGTLDPMAEGVVKIIVGEGSRNKEEYISPEKTYQFKILFGFSTDTHDALGLIDEFINSFSFQQEAIESSIKSFLGFYRQQYPNYSSKKILGKSLWQYEREGIKVPEVYIDGEVKSIEIVSFNNLEAKKIIEKIKNQIHQIHGNFRQKEILKKYESIEIPEYFIAVEVKVVMTRGLYVRGFVRDLSKKVNLPCIVLDLIRLKDGETEKKDCLNTEEYFKDEINTDENFLNPVTQNQNYGNI